MRVGFLGAGLIAGVHADSLRASGEPHTIVAVHDPDPARAAGFGARHGARPCASTAEVLERSDAVYVCTWTSEHRRLVEEVASRGLAVFCEKPLGIDLASARAMTDAVRAAGVTNQVGLVLRRSPTFALLRALVTDPAAGRPMSVVFRDDQHLPVAGFYDSTWRGDVRRAGGGTLLEHSIHDLDLLELLLGTVTSVSARSAGFHAIDGIDDVMVVTLTFANGAVGSLISVWHDVLARRNMRRVEVLCERRWAVEEGDWAGTVRWTDVDGGGGHVEGDDVVARGEPLVDGPINPDAAFLRAATAGGPAWPDFATALRAHVLADAVYRSAAAGGVTVEV